MAYLTNSLAIVQEETDKQALALKGFCQRRRADLAAGDQPSGLILDLYVRLRADRAAFAAAAATPGIAEYARSVKNNPNYDVVAEFQGMMSAIDGVIAWIAANFPKDPGGFLLARTLGSDGPIDRLFTPAQTAGLRTQLDAVIASIA